MPSQNAVSRFEIIEIPIFGSRFVICHGSNKKAAKFLKEELGYSQKEPLLPKDSGARTQTLYNKANGTPIWVLLFPKGVLDRSTVVHEVFHLVASITDYHGLEEEAGAYLAEWIYSSI